MSKGKAPLRLTKLIFTKHLLLTQEVSKLFF